MEIELFRMSHIEYRKATRQFQVYGVRHPYDVIHLKGQTMDDVFKHLNSGLIIRPKPIHINHHQTPKSVLDEIISFNKQRFYWRAL